jgi:DNA repair ATPase RecN
MGTVIGDKLRRLAHGGDNGSAGVKKSKKPVKAQGLQSLASGGQQVLCITHLPQIAAFADRHLRIAKSVDGSGKQKQTRTTVTVLKGPDRVEELAEMLAGKDVSDTTRKQVQEMLVAAGA